MNIVSTDGCRIDGVCACLPKRSVDNLAACAELYGDAKRAGSVVAALGIGSRRIASAGVTSLDLCVRAAGELLGATGVDPKEVRAVICVTFTPAMSMPSNACQAQSLLGLPQDVIAFDLGLACSGYAYGLFVASTVAAKTGGRVLLLDGDVQSAVVRRDDEATVPVLADAGTATLVSPDASAEPWRFAFMCDGSRADALRLPVGGTVGMDGFAVYSFVATTVSGFVRRFMEEAGLGPGSFDRFVPHQANVYMIRQLARSLGIPAERLCVSGDALGNSASASVPVTIAWTKAVGRLLVAGFGGGLSASAGAITVPPSAFLGVVEA